MHRYHAAAIIVTSKAEKYTINPVHDMYLDLAKRSRATIVIDLQANCFKLMYQTHLNIPGLGYVQYSLDS